MLNPELLSLIFAILSPVLWGLMNVIDKYVVSCKVKNALSFAFIAGMVNLAMGLIIAIFLNQSGFSIKELLFPAIAGILGGSQFYLYYIMLQKEDISNLVGFIYFYPILVAFLSFFFLNEVLSLMSYIGISLILLGVITLSVRIRKIKAKLSLWMIITMIIVVAFYEFFIRVATINLPEINGISLNTIFIGLTLIPLLIHKKTRKGIRFELKNIKWALLSESLTFLGVLTFYFAMAGLPATIVSSIAACQPLVVLILEKIFHKCGIKICRDHKNLS